MDPLNVLYVCAAFIMCYMLFGIAYHTFMIFCLKSPVGTRRRKVADWFWVYRP